MLILQTDEEFKNVFYYLNNGQRPKYLSFILYTCIQFSVFRLKFKIFIFFNKPKVVYEKMEIKTIGIGNVKMQ